MHQHDTARLGTASPGTANPGMASPGTVSRIRVASHDSSEQAAQAPASIAMGSSIAPTGEQIRVDRISLLRNDRRWLPVMGEFHYARYPASEWRDSLLKMKMGGIDIVATYVFWIHHEEVEGEFDWTGRRNLREFLRLCGEAGLNVVVRCGPWCHGECRNGGLPDWLLASGVETRSNDPDYLAYVETLYAQIASQLSGLLWKDGGPVVGIQCENEYGGPAEHLLKLKGIASNAGLDVPLYTRTGWPELCTPLPLGEMIPLFGGYPDGFWDRSLEEMPAGYGTNFLFRRTRNDASVATDQLGIRAAAAEEPENAFYPYFACEIGGGMMTSYHRRIRIDSPDIESLALVKIGSGNNLQGYYMYHGGTNPDGKLSTLQESQATRYWNDLPVKTYDFQAPLGEFGQARAHYHTLRRLHLFLRDFGASLADMPTFLPDALPSGSDDRKTLRWSVRSNGRSGFLFVNNYQRLQPMAAKKDVQFELVLDTGGLRIPAQPADIPENSCFVWPFHLDLSGAFLIYATAQLVCQVADGPVTYVVFAQTAGVMPEFVFDAESVTVDSANGLVEEHGTAAGGRVRIHNVGTGTGAAISLRTAAGGNVKILLLDVDQSHDCYKAELCGRPRIFLSRALLRVEGDRLCLEAADPQDLAVSILPAGRLICHEHGLKPIPDGLFYRSEFAAPTRAPVNVTLDLLREAGPARHVGLGSQGVAEAPADAEFQNAALYRIEFGGGFDHRPKILLRINYVGDVARLALNGVLLTDNFYNGTTFEIGLWRYAPDIYSGELLLEILPMARDAPIYLSNEARSVLCNAEDGVPMPHVTAFDLYETETTFTETN